jgi:branched-chain amino acid transport system substrate-binding protein
MKKKIIWAIVLVVAIILLVITKTQSTKNGEFTVGAILPMTGPAAIWGETMKNGMQLALEEKPDLKVLYEDSKSTAVDGISAYNSLQNKNVNLTVSALSIVSVPLSKIALERKEPLLVSLVAAKHDSIVNDYTTRYYTDPANYSGPTFTDPISPVLKSTKIALLYRNDELGNSVKDKIQEYSDKYGKKIVYSESFLPAEKDYNTFMTKIKDSGADVLVFVDSTPGEAVAIVKAAYQLKIGIPVVESSVVLADKDTQKQLEGMSFYTTAYGFSLPDRALDFKAKYKSKFGKEPSLGAAFGYDIVNLVYKCKDSKEDIQKCLSNLQQIEGVAGSATQVLPQDFVVQLHLEKVN